MPYTLVLPFHSDLTSIVGTVRRARDEGGREQIGEILLAHNGRPLAPDAQARIDALVSPPHVRFVHTDAKGIGAGYRLGIREAQEEFIILSADDLPFGWTDVRAFEKAGRPDFAIGSKAHRDSRITGVTLPRRVSTLVFRMLRTLLLGARTPGDSQGTLIIRTDVAKRLLPHVRYDHYLCSLELATLHLESGGEIVELAVVNEDAPHPSSVSVVSDGWRMMKELVELRERVRGRRRSL